MNIDSHRLVETLVAEQLKPWRSAALNREACRRYILEQANHSASLFAYEIGSSGVSIHEKVSTHKHPAFDAYLLRAKQYEAFFANVLSEVTLDSNFVIAIDVADGACDHAEAPVFSFQKAEHERNILLPDVEILTTNFFADVPDDQIAFMDKECKAVFAGSTTGGGIIDSYILQSDSMPRLRAARFFKNTRLVDFQLTQLVQCASDDIVSALQAEGFGGNWIGWKKSYNSKFGISIDGNGAACSRPAVILKSHCALVKYKSPFVLYYFSSLEPNKHYIEVSSETEVMSIVEEELASPGTFLNIAEDGRNIVGSLLSKSAVSNYACCLLQEYSRLV